MLILVLLITIYTTGSMPLLVDVSSPGYHQPSSQHFGVDMNINYMVILINFLYKNLEFFEKTKDFHTPGVDYLSRIWHNVLEFLGPQCSSTLYLFGFFTILI